MKVIKPISPILTLKLVTMATSLEQSEKRGQISNLRSNTYHMVKIWCKSVRKSLNSVARKIIKNEYKKKL